MASSCAFSYKMSSNGGPDSIAGCVHTGSSLDTEPCNRSYLLDDLRRSEVSDPEEEHEQSSTWICCWSETGSSCFEQGRCCCFWQLLLLLLLMGIAMWRTIVATLLCNAAAAAACCCCCFCCCSLLCSMSGLLPQQQTTTIFFDSSTLLFLPGPPLSGTAISLNPINLRRVALRHPPTDTEDFRVYLRRRPTDARRPSCYNASPTNTCDTSPATDQPL